MPLQDILIALDTLKRDLHDTVTRALRDGLLDYTDERDAIAARNRAYSAMEEIRRMLIAEAFDNGTLTIEQRVTLTTLSVLPTEGEPSPVRVSPV